MIPTRSLTLPFGIDTTAQGSWTRAPAIVSLPKRRHGRVAHVAGIGALDRGCRPGMTRQILPLGRGLHEQRTAYTQRPPRHGEAPTAGACSSKTHARHSVQRRAWCKRHYVREKPSSSTEAQSSVFSMGSPCTCRTIIFGMMAWVQIWAATRGGAGEQAIVLL